MTMATVAFIAVTAWGVFCLEKGADIEWFKTYTTVVSLLAFFGIGSIGATDVIKELRNK